MSDPSAERQASVTRLEVGLNRAWLFLVACSALYFVSDNRADNDLWMHLLVGRRILYGGAVPRIDNLSYTATGSPWVDHEWLAQVVFAWIFENAGTGGLWLFKVALGLATAGLVWRAAARRSDRGWAVGGTMLMTLAVLSRGFSIRPQIFTYLGVAALLSWLARDDGDSAAGAAWRGIVAVALAFAAWANLHGAFVVGLGILVLYAWLPPWRGVVRRSLLPVVAVAAACVNPYGPFLFGYIAGELQAPHPLTEWQPVSLGVAHAPFLAMLLLCVATAPFARLLRRRPWWAALLVVTAFLALRHQRHTPLFALCAAIPLSEQLSVLGARVQKRFDVTLSDASLVFLLTGLVTLGLTQLSLLALRLKLEGPSIVYEASEYPVGAVRFLQVEGERGNLALPIDWGGYLLWHASPQISVSLDGRFATVYSPSVVEDNFAFFRGDDGPRSRALLEDYPTNLILAPRGVRTTASDLPGWSVRYRDDVAELLERGATGPPVRGEAPVGRLTFP